jgi:hypothetical protein
VKSANPRLEIVEVIPNRTNFGQFEVNFGQTSDNSKFQQLQRM